MLNCSIAAAAQFHDFSSSGKKLRKIKVCRVVLSLRAADTAAAQFHDFSSGTIHPSSALRFLLLRSSGHCEL
jgi:hypothetical protein